MSSVTVDGSDFTLTNSGANGGAVASGILGSGIAISGSQFTSISAVNDGGAVSSGAAVTVRGGTRFVNVTSLTGRGGAIWTNRLDMAQTEVADARSTREVRLGRQSLS